MFKPTFHRNGTVTLWNVYTQTWTRTASPSAPILASLSPALRTRVVRHVSRA